MRRRRKRSGLTSSPADGETVRPSASDINRQLGGWTPRRVASWSLMVVGGVIAVQHLLAHAGAQPLPFSMGWQDLLVGYPAAALLAFAGLLLVDPRPRI